MARLTHSDRIKMEALLNAGHSVKEIANQLHVHQATIYREYNRGKYMHRNSDYTEEERYSSDLGQQAHDWYITGKGRPLKIKNDIKYIEKLEKKILDEKYSPEAALNALQQEGEQMCISVRTLYRYIDDGIFLKLTNAHLPVKGKAKKKEKQKPVQKRASAGVSIEKRPEEIMTREEFGHWEMDTVKGKRGVTKSCLLVLSERKTRNEIVIKMPDQGAASVVASLDMLEEKWGKLFSTVFKSITVDNGVEFSDTVGLERSCLRAEKRTALYYCHAYSSWERGTNENINKLIRLWFARSVANRMSKALLRCAPILVVALFLPKPYRLMLPQDPMTLFLFLLTMILGTLVTVAIGVIIYTSCCFTISAQGIRIFYASACELLSGQIVPLPFMPEVVQRVLKVLPFAAMQNVPFRIYSGDLSGRAMAEAIFLQIFWLIVLVGAGWRFAKLAEKKLVVQGG